MPESGIGAVVVTDNRPMSDPLNADEAVAEVRRHVEALFDAFLAKDRAALRNGRIDDWKGSRSRVRA